MVLSEVLYCPEHQEYLNTLHMINRQIEEIMAETERLVTSNKATHVDEFQNSVRDIRSRILDNCRVTYRPPVH